MLSLPGRLLVTTLTLAGYAAVWLLTEAVVIDLGRPGRAFRLFMLVTGGMLAALVLWSAWRPERRIVLPDTPPVHRPAPSVRVRLPENHDLTVRPGDQPGS